MAPRWLYPAAAAATLALAACSEREPDSTTGPQFAPGRPDACGFSNELISDYFPSSHTGIITNLKTSMANAGQGTTNARTFGFEIMDSIGSLSRTAATVDPSAGAALTNALIGCMFTQTFTYPTNAASPFAAALSNADGGAYYVRGGGSGGVDVEGRKKTVLGRTKSLSGVETNLSGIDTTSASWTTTLSTNGLSEGRALIYGYPVTTNPLVFE
ncbi:MAG TPA: hypothetical protein VJ808_10710, partial [Gemmatimonadales bacterium]|nr:hypothetical protein [Gemmatimonadales bacterium]